METKNLLEQRETLNARLIHYKKVNRTTKTLALAIFVLFIVLTGLHLTNIADLRFMLGSLSGTCILGATLCVRQDMKISVTETAIEEINKKL